MAGSLNRVTLIGLVGKDPEVRAMQNGTKLASFSLATTESWKDRQSGERKEATEWHKVSVFNENLVGIVEQYVQKGSKLLVEGALKTRKYTGQDGTDRYSTEIVLQSFNGQIILLSPKNGEGSSQGNGERYRSGPTQSERRAAPQSGRMPAPASDELDSEIPF